MNDTFLALDLGGTKLLVGEVNDKGEILNYKRYFTGYIDQQCALEIIKNSIDDYIQSVGWATGNVPKAIGIGLIGRIDNENGIWHQIDIDRTQPLELAKSLSHIYNLPCYIDNDVKSATRAERLFGYGRKSDNFIYINIGTGIAAGFVINGQMLRGSCYNAGEVGHINVGVGIGLDCVCGRKNCVELVASGMGFDKCARHLKNKYQSALKVPGDEKERVDVREIYRLYNEEDEMCVFLVNNAVEAIAQLIMNLVRVSDPDTVVLGGGIVANDFLYPKILDKLNKHTMRFVSNGVVLTKLDPNFIGLIGAAAVAMNK